MTGYKGGTAEADRGKTRRIMETAWVLEKVRLLVLNQRMYHGLPERAVCKAVDDTGLVYVPVIRDGKARFLTEFYGVPEREFWEQAERNTLEDDWERSYSLGRMCSIKPAVPAFLHGGLDRVYRDGEGEIYIFPFSMESVMTLPASSCGVEEAVGLYKGSLENLIDLGVVREPEVLGETVYLYRNGRIITLNKEY